MWLLEEMRTAAAAQASAAAATESSVRRGESLGQLRAEVKVLREERSVLNQSVIELTHTLGHEQKRVSALMAAVVGGGGGDGDDGDGRNPNRLVRRGGEDAGGRGGGENTTFKRRMQIIEEAGSLFEDALHKQDKFLKELVQHDDVQSAISKNVELLLEWRLGHGEGPMERAEQGSQTEHTGSLVT